MTVIQNRIRNKLAGHFRLIMTCMTLLGLVLLLAGCAGFSSSGREGRSDVRKASLKASEGHESSSRSSLSSGREATGGAEAGHGSAAAEKDADGGHGSPAAGKAADGGGHGTGQGGKVHWEYTGDLGPSHWGDLADKFATCTFGNSQSPIDLAGSIEPEPANIEISYHPTPLRILNNGHTLQVNYEPGSHITIGHSQYELLQFHFHVPSEHEVATSSFPMEGHLVHKDSHGELAVIGVFMMKGEANPFFQALADHLPSHADEEKVVAGMMVNVQDMLPHDQSIYTYSGSLTTPPCSESVSWNVMSTPVEVSSQQIAAFASILGYNARPVQPLNGRAVSGQHPGEGQVSAGADHGAPAPEHGAAAPSPEHAAAAPAHGSAGTDSGGEGHGAAVHWGYGDLDGPQLWGSMSAEFSACSSGLRQSPINVQSALTPSGSGSVLPNYGDTLVTIKNNGHTIQVDYDSGSGAYFNGEPYQLLQFHFHTPSENMVNNAPYPMEMHLVHQNSNGGLGVIAMMFEEGEENPLLATFWDFLPRKVGEVSSDLRVNMGQMFPASPSYYAFDGSLTTPPCSEGVEWFLMKGPVQASKTQIDKFMSIFGPNARPVQPLNNRSVDEF